MSTILFQYKYITSEYHDSCVADNFCLWKNYIHFYMHIRDFKCRYKRVIGIDILVEKLDVFRSNFIFRNENVEKSFFYILCFKEIANLSCKATFLLLEYYVYITSSIYRTCRHFRDMC